MNLPKEVEKFVNNLVPTDVGVDTVGDFVIHYEGFTDECNDGYDDDSIDEVYAEVFQDFDDRQGEEAIIRGVANDSLGCENNPVLYSVYGELTETNLDFKLIDQEISEARLYRTTSGFNQLTGESVSELLYLNTLITYMMYKDKKQSKFAQSYAKQTIQYGKYTLFRSHATDLYLLANVVSNPDSKTVSRLRQPGKSERYLKSLKFDKRTHWTFMMNIANGRITDTVASPYMFRLESQLKIKKSIYKQWRRLIMDWENLKYNQKQYIVTKIAQELRRLGRGSEVLTPVSHMIKYRSYKTNDKFKKNTGRKVAGAVAGGIAGRYAGKKIAQKLGKNVDKYKRVGTGLGAIAGYWAGGRSRQI